MIKTPLLIFVQFIAIAAWSQSFDDYREMNNSEMRLTEFKDSDDMLRLKLAQLEVINKSRKRYKAPPVKLDILASRVANKQSKEAAEGNFKGHWNLRGEKPYHRWAFAGGKDHVTENAAATWIQGSKFDGKLETHAKLMADLHGEFMAEKAPYDGHKKTIIEKAHTHVGIGCHMTSTQFRYYEEFVDRYAEIGEVPQTVAVNEEFVVRIRPNGGQYLFYGVAYAEKPPKPLSSNQVNKKGSYPDYTDVSAVKYAPWDLVKYKDSDGFYNVPWSFAKKNLYYIQFYVDPNDPANLRAFNTSGKTPVTGLVVMVQ